MAAFLLTIASNLIWLLQNSGRNPNKNLDFLLAAFIVTWIFILGYCVTLAYRQKRLDREIELLKQMREEKESQV